MNKISILIVVIALANIGAARWLPKKEDIKKTAKDWSETAEKIGLDEEQKMAVVDLMKFLQDEDISSAEMETKMDWKKPMMQKCEKFAKFEKIDEMDDKMDDKKWKDMKGEDFDKKMDFWQKKYMAWEKDEDKMKALKNMCIMIIEGEKKKEFKELIKSAGMKEKDMEPMINMMWKMKAAKTMTEKKMAMLKGCSKMEMDDAMMMIDESPDMAGMKWSDMKDMDMPMKMQFWWDKMKMVDCKISKTKAMKNMCVLYMDAKERKMIEDWAKMAEFKDEDKKAVIDMEMKMKMAMDKAEKKEMMLMDCKDLGKDKIMMEMTMSADDMKKWEDMKDKEYMDKLLFWFDKYNKMTEGDKMKSLKNVCVLIMEEKDKEMSMKMKKE